MRNETIKFTRALRKSLVESEGSLKEELQQLISHPNTPEINDAINAKQDEISTLEKKKLYDIPTKKKKLSHVGR